MNNLVIDIGNSNTHIAIFSNKLVSSAYFPTHGDSSIKDADSVFANQNEKLIKHCAISSVVPEKETFWFQYIKIKLNVSPVIINNKIKLPIKIKIKNSDSLGSDRIGNAVFGYEYFKRKQNVIVIDMGTALTLNVILKNGDFIGGIIAPGIGMSSKALNYNTGKLPFIGKDNLLFPKSVIGNDTKSAMQSGLLNTTRYAIEGLINAISKETKRTFKTILTGGNAKVFANKLSFKPVYVENAVLEGLNNIIEYNK
jgi:type III pantothenate kinase